MYLSIDLSKELPIYIYIYIRFSHKPFSNCGYRPLPFADKPAALFLLVDGLRNASASEWCAKRFHTHLLPRLSAPWLQGVKLMEIGRNLRSREVTYPY